MSAFCQHFLGFRDCFGRIEVFGAGVGAIHNRVAAIEAEWVFQLIQPLTGGLITAVDQPAIRRQQRRRTEVAITVPPVAWAAGRTTGTQNAGCGLVDPFLVFLALPAVRDRAALAYASAARV